MQLKSFAIFGVLLSSCASLPPVTPCVYSPEESGAWCAPPESDEVVFKPNAVLGNYVCHSPEDHQSIVEWMQRHKGVFGKSTKTKVGYSYFMEHNRRVHEALRQRFKQVTE